MAQERLKVREDRTAVPELEEEGLRYQRHTPPGGRPKAARIKTLGEMRAGRRCESGLMGTEMGSKPRDRRDHEGRGADRGFVKRQSTTTKGTKSCSNLDKEETFLPVLKGDLKNPTRRTTMRRAMWPSFLSAPVTLPCRHRQHDEAGIRNRRTKGKMPAARTHR